MGTVGTVRSAVVVAALAVAASCGEAGTAPGDQAGPSSTAASAPAPAGEPAVPAPATETAAVVPEALRFTAAGVDGGQVAGTDYAGRDVALWFWAPW